jgi:hypothetical protein
VRLKKLEVSILVRLGLNLLNPLHLQVMEKRFAVRMPVMPKRSSPPADDGDETSKAILLKLYQVFSSKSSAELRQIEAAHHQTSSKSK